VGSASAMDEMTFRLIDGRAGIPDLHGVTLFLKEGASIRLWGRR